MDELLKSEGGDNVASISGTLTAGYIPAHEDAVKAVLEAAEKAIREAGEKAGFNAVFVNHSVGGGTGHLSVSMAKDA